MSLSELRCVLLDITKRIHISKSINDEIIIPLSNFVDKVMNIAFTYADDIIEDGTEVILRKYFGEFKNLYKHALNQMVNELRREPPNHLVNISLLNYIRSEADKIKIRLSDKNIRAISAFIYYFLEEIIDISGSTLMARTINCNNEDICNTITYGDMLTAINKDNELNMFYSYVINNNISTNIFLPMSSATQITLSRINELTLSEMILLIIKLSPNVRPESIKTNYTAIGIIKILTNKNLKQTDLEMYTVKQLRDFLRGLDLKINGYKSEIIQRLCNYKTSYIF